MRTLRRFLQLPASDRRIAVKSLTLLFGIRLGLGLLPFSRLRSTLDRVASQPPDRELASRRAEDLARIVSAASRYVPRASCLVQALALEVLLRRSGHAAELRIGVERVGGDLKAHAWVESEGQRFLEDPDPSRFAPLPSGWQT